MFTVACVFAFRTEYQLTAHYTHTHYTTSVYRSTTHLRSFIYSFIYFLPVSVARSTFNITTTGAQCIMGYGFCVCCTPQCDSMLF